MKTQYLHDVWSAPDNTRLVSKQFSFRLPVHIAAKIAALGELYPHKNRTQIVSDLLTVALDDLEKNLPIDPWELDPEESRTMRDLAAYDGHPYEETYTIGGARGRFRASANKHYRELEKELGNESAEKLYQPEYGSKEYIKGLAGK